MPVEWLEFAFELFESLSKGSNLDSNTSNPFRFIIRMLQIPFEKFEFAFVCFKPHSNGSNLHSNASNPFQMGRIEFALECVEFGSNG